MIQNIIKFIYENDLLKQKLDLNKVIGIIENQGFTIRSFSCEDITNDRSDISKLRINNYASSHECFTFIQRKIKLKQVWILEDIPTRDRLLPLLHEEAHIYNEHFSNTDGLVHTTSIRKELQANLFSYIILSINRISLYFKKSLLIAALISTVIIAGSILFNAFTVQDHGVEIVQSENTQNEFPEYEGTTVYWSTGGEVFHLYENCTHLRQAYNISSGSAEESDKNRCCLDCLKKKERLDFIQDNINKYKEKQ